jgi:hypothetical protein
MPQGPYSGLGYQMSAIGAAVPAGYMSGVQMRNQQDLRDAQLQQERLKAQQEQIGMQRSGEQYAAMKQAGINATDEEGNLDYPKYAAGVAASGQNVLSPYGTYQAKQGANAIRGQAVSVQQQKALQAIIAQDAHAMSQMPDSDREDFFESNTKAKLQGLGMPDEEIEKLRPMVHNDKVLSGAAQSYAGAAKVAAQDTTKMDIATMNRDARLYTAKLASSTRLAQQRMSFEQKPISNAEGALYHDLTSKGIDPQEAFGIIQENRLNLAIGKQKHISPATAAANAVENYEKMNGKLSDEKRENLYNAYYRMQAEASAEAPATPPVSKVAAPSAVKTQVKDGKTWYEWAPGEWHTAQPQGK